MATFTSYKTKDGKRKYKFKVYLGKDPLTGKRIETSRQGFNSKKEAQTALRNVQADFEKNGWKKQNNKLETFDIEPSFMKVGNYMTSIDMAGISLTLFEIQDDKWLDYLNYPVKTIAW